VKALLNLHRQTYKMETVQIKIKSPSANIPDLEFKCDVNEKIIEIKRRISESYPTKPAESAQKLVYSGKILKDSDHLCNILRFEDECSAFTFHLVCSIPQKKTLPTSIDGLRQRTNAIPSSSNATSATSLPEPVSTSNNMHQNNPMMEDMMRTFSAQYSQAMASMPSTPSQEEVMAMQQMYNQYLSLYMQYMQSQSTPQQSQVLFHQNLPAQNQFNLPEPHHVHAAPAPPVAGEAAPNAAMVMNAGAAGQIQDDAGGDRNRDILDWVYVMTRVLLLFSVIYFHSSFLRLAFVAGLGFLVYLYQNRRNGRVRVGAPNPQQDQGQLQPDRRNARPAVRAQNPPAHPELGEHQDEVVPAGENEDDDNVETDSIDENSETPLVEEPKPSRFAVIFTFFSTLVSSIIPEQPQVV